MKGVARISFQGGALFVPAKTPYDRELLFEHLDLYARRHGTIRVELNRREWTVRKAERAQQSKCDECEREIDALSYALAGRALCSFCARKGVR